MNSKSFRILALDGGGVRGAFTARYLLELEYRLGRPITNYFDLVVGTSTGGIVAIALGLSMSPQVVLDLYRLHGDNLFRNSVWCRLRALAGAKHDTKRFHTALKSVFGEKRLGDSIIPLCIPVVDETNGRIKVLKTDHHPALFTDCKRFAWEVAAATSAAPFYFESFFADGAMNLLDGGLWANNPSLVGLCEAIRMFDCKPSDVSILSIGTGQEQLGQLRTRFTSVGLLRPRKVRRLARLVLAGQAQAVDRMVEYIGTNVYRRIQPIFPQAISMDDSRMIKYLESLASQLAQETLQNVTMEFCQSQTVPFTPQHKRKDMTYEAERSLRGLP